MPSSPSRSENSFTFSLHELARMEEERIARERSQADQRREAARAAIEEAERERRDAQRKKREEEERERSAAEWREREAAARIEAIQRAALEEARLTAEAMARLEAAEAERRRLRERAAAEIAPKKSETGARILVGAIGLFVGCGIAAGIYFGPIAKGHARELAESNGAIEEAKRENAKLKSQESAREGELTRTKGELTTARARATDLQEKLDAKPKEPVKPPPKVVLPPAKQPEFDLPFRICGPNDKGDPTCIHQ